MFKMFTIDCIDYTDERPKCAGRSLKITFDMKDVTYIVSSFIRSCIVISSKVDEGNFNIINASPVMKKTFKIAGLDELLKVK